jgi:hypothetical protein
MKGDIDNTSYVELDGAPAARSRVVYGVKAISEQRIQVGYVQVDYRNVVVWRPYDPDDMGWEAPWKTGHWRNAYVTVMPRDQETKDPRRPTYSVTDFVDDNVTAQLPRVELRLHHALKAHLTSGSRAG